MSPGFAAVSAWPAVAPPTTWRPVIVLALRRPEVFDDEQAREIDRHRKH
jgi:hypothetical protein